MPTTNTPPVPPITTLPNFLSAPGPAITTEDYANAALALGCEVASVKAVASVESQGAGYLPSGKMKMLFEGHIFHRYTNGKYSKTHPKISYPTWTKQFYLGGEAEWGRFLEAFYLDERAAYLSASYGKFQVMGFNFGTCGFPAKGGGTVEQFYDYLNVSEGNQLTAFCAFIKSNPNDLLKPIRARDWASFARAYNGASYAENKYDQKLAAAYKIASAA